MVFIDINTYVNKSIQYKLLGSCNISFIDIYHFFGPLRSYGFP